jgi:hypothetical protein
MNGSSSHKVQEIIHSVSFELPSSFSNYKILIDNYSDLKVSGTLTKLKPYQAVVLLQTNKIH